jgi:hypothetical protein
MRSACEGEPFYREHAGKRYCVLHFPSPAKTVKFLEVVRRKLANQDFDFRGVWFPSEALFFKILGPVQAALLALAIRRKFMR